MLCPHQHAGADLAHQLRPCYLRCGRTDRGVRIALIPRLALVAVGGALVVAACGSSSTPGSARAGNASGGIKLAACIRAHGVPNFPDPSGGGGGINLERTGINPQSPAFKSARRACAGLAPGAVGGVRATEQQFLAALTFSRCMRTQGFPDFPDPTRVDSPPGPIFIVGPGLFFRVSAAFDPESPPTRRAVAACART